MVQTTIIRAGRSHDGSVANHRGAVGTHDCITQHRRNIKKWERRIVKGPKAKS
jgi:hypothetical protein